MQSNNKFTETLIALMGLWLIVKSLPDLIVAVSAKTYLGDDFSNDNLWIISVAYNLAVVACGVMLIVARYTITKLLGGTSELTIDSRQLLSAALFFLGVYLCITGVQDLIQFAFSASEYRSDDNYPLWQGVVSLIFGLVLAMYSVSLSKMWWHLQQLVKR